MTPTWFGEELPTFLELICTHCGKEYSRDIQRMVRPGPIEHCFCGKPYPQFRYIEEVKT